MSKRVTYRPPSAKAIDECAQKICKDLSHALGQSLTTEVQLGLAGYLKVVAAIAAKRLNQEQANLPEVVAESVDKLEQKS